MRTKSQDRIELSDGRVMTLREALDSGAVRLVTFQRYNRRTLQSKPVLVAREAFGDQATYWEVSQKVTAPKCRQCRGPVEPERLDYVIPTCFACLPPPQPLPIR